MMVEGFCRACNKGFDAHWHRYPELTLTEAVMSPYCPYCKEHEVQITTDESPDPEEPDYDNEDE